MNTENYISFPKKDYKKLFEILLEFNKKNNPERLQKTIKIVEEIKNRKPHNIQQHIEGMIFALLSSQRTWGPIEENKDYIREVFFNFDKEKIKETNYNYFVEKLNKKNLGNRNIKKQMSILTYNIKIFEMIEKEKGSIDNFIFENSNDIILKLSSFESKYKLKQMGISLICEYLKNIRVDALKPDTHIIRIFYRLGLIKSENSIGEEILKVLNITEQLSKQINLLKCEIDFLLWNYCAVDYGNICNYEPKCGKCVIKDFCEYKN